MRAIEQFIRYLRSCYAPELVSSIRITTEAAGACLSGLLERSAATVVIGDEHMGTLLARHGLRPTFSGWSPDGEHVAVVERTKRPARGHAPPWFRVAAIVPVFNEADVIGHTLEYLIREGIAVHVLDNWSTDATPRIVQQLQARGLVTVERFPSDHPNDVYDLRGILTRVEELGQQLDADWIMLHDADERRRSPWPGVGLRDALYRVDGGGFTCIDHVTLNFWPVDDGFDGTRDLEAYFRHFEFSAHPGHFHQRRAWRNAGDRVSLAPTAGHDVGFDGRRVYPYKFLLKHYPLRSRAHALRKVFHERRARFSPAERTLGWHQQYDQLSAIVRRPDELHYFDPNTFYQQWLVERLSGVGIFESPPDWATPPTWLEPVVA